jgi:hypothetical protein
MEYHSAFKKKGILPCEPEGCYVECNKPEQKDKYSIISWIGES